MNHIPVADSIELEHRTDDQVTRIQDLCTAIGRADVRLHADLAATDIRHVPVSEYPPDRIDRLLADAKETAEYCRSMRTLYPDHHDDDMPPLVPREMPTGLPPGLRN